MGILWILGIRKQNKFFYGTQKVFFALDIDIGRKYCRSVEDDFHRDIFLKHEYIVRVVRNIVVTFLSTRKL